MGSWDSGTWDSSIWDVTEGESGLYYYPSLWPHYYAQKNKKPPKLDTVKAPKNVDWKFPEPETVEQKLKRLDKEMKDG